MMDAALRVLIVDDEPLARLRLAQLLADLSAEEGDLGAVHVAGEAADAAAALAWLQQHSADLMLLDVQMPGLDGTALAQRLRALPDPPAVVFVTAHGEHALRAFELDAVDFLTKPVRRERLREALLRVQRRLQSRAPFLVVHDRGATVRVPLSSVLYLKAELKYVTLQTLDRGYVLDDALTDLERRLGPAVLRVHRNALVALHAVRSLERGPGEEHWEVVVGPQGHRLPVSRRLLPAVRLALAGSGV